MNFRCIAILFILIGFMIASAHGQEITILPYLQNTSPNSTYILWEVDAFGRGEVIYGKDPRALNKSKKSIRSNTDSKHQLHAALIKNLKSNTKYYYRVLMGDGNTSELYSFKTPEVFRSRNATQFILLSNIERHQALPTIFKEICNDGILQKSEDEIGLNPSDLEAILISGDMSNPGIEGYRDHFFKHGKDILPYVPYYVIPGENEYLDDSLKNFVHFNRLPKNGPKTLNQRVWYKDISNIRIIAVDTHLKGKEQAICKSWLEELLEKSCSYESIDFILLMMYHPSRSEFRPKPKPIFARYLIQQLDAFANRCDKLVVHSSGEDHGYSKGFSNEARHVWISPGSAAGVLDEWGIQKNIDVEEYSVSTDDYGFVLLNFTADELPKVTFKRYSRGNDRMGQRNALKDHFTVQKIASKPSQPIGIYPNKDSILNQCIRLKAAPFNDGNAKA
ncbi:MAG: metallophosphoesterase family protein, partial [Bacteroidota bacterium]